MEQGHRNFHPSVSFPKAVSSHRISLEANANELALYRFLNKSMDVEDFKARISRLLKPIGIDDFSHHQFNVSGHSGAVLDPFGTYSKEFISEYSEAEFWVFDSALRHVQKSLKGICQSAINEHISSASYIDDSIICNRDIARYFSRHGVLDSYNFGIAEEGYRATMSFSSGRLEPVEFKKMLSAYELSLRTLGAVVDVIGRKKFKSHFHNTKANPSVLLQSKSVQILELMNKDFTLEQIAEVTQLSVSTVGYHLSKAKEAFGTSTSHGTLGAAIKEGIIKT